MKCPIIKKCGGCFYPQDKYQEELKEKTLFIEKEIKKTKLKIDALAMAGMDNGSIILKKTIPCPAPSITAASSNSLLALAKAAVYMMDAHPAPCQIPLAI